MADGLDWTTDIDNDVAVLVAAVLATDANAEIRAARVYVGPADAAVSLPFVSIWPLRPSVVGAGLAGESAGRALGRWQIAGHAATTGQARYLVEILTGAGVWPAGWSVESDSVGEFVRDDSGRPSSWFVPFVAVRHTV